MPNQGAWKSFGFMKLPHLNAKGEAHMVDVKDKPKTQRLAEAEAFVRLSPQTLSLLGDAQLAKGDALAVARIAGIMGSKKVADLIPLCHPLNLNHVSVELSLQQDGVRILARTQTTGPTGVEMEALTAASCAALALYDMIKAHERGAVIERVQLLRKEGGKSGTWTRSEN